MKVTRNALEKRIRRSLKARGLRLRKTRPGTRRHQDLGLYYVDDPLRNTIVAHHTDIEDMARDLGAIESYEEVQA